MSKIEKIEEYYPNGMLSNKETLKDGKRHGLYRSWFPWGQKMSEDNYKNGKIWKAKKI